LTQDKRIAKSAKKGREMNPGQVRKDESIERLGLGAQEIATGGLF
jgi:hypothetical protein